MSHSTTSLNNNNNQHHHVVVNSDSDSVCTTVIVVEVCVDSVESLENAIRGGATRIELCSALTLGGLTPSMGLMKYASLYARTIPIHCMIRPRQGDFCYSPAEVEVMKTDIEVVAKLGLQGVVFGALTPDGLVDIVTNHSLMQVAKKRKLDTTFHRAFDQCPRDKIEENLEQIITLEFDRILTSGLAQTAMKGKRTIEYIVDLVQGRIQIMAGAGIHATNVNEILESTGVTQLHLSGRIIQPSAMQASPPHHHHHHHYNSRHSRHSFSNGTIPQLGALDDYATVPVTSREAIESLVQAILGPESVQGSVPS